MAGQVLVFVIMTLLEGEDLRDRVLRLAGPARPAPYDRGDGRRSASDQHELDEGVDHYRRASCAGADNRIVVNRRSRLLLISSPVRARYIVRRLFPAPTPCKGSGRFLKLKSR
jgi:hypothetical protein